MTILFYYLHSFFYSGFRLIYDYSVVFVRQNINGAPYVNPSDFSNFLLLRNKVKIFAFARKYTTILWVSFFGEYETVSRKVGSRITSIPVSSLISPLSCFQFGFITLYMTFRETTSDRCLHAL